MEEETPKPGRPRRGNDLPHDFFTNWPDIPVGDDDKWKGEVGSGYSAEKWYITAVENHHSTSLQQTRVPPGVFRGIEIAVFSRETPYRTFGDFIRDALVHNLVRVAELIKDEQFLAEVFQEADRTEALAAWQKRKLLQEDARTLKDFARELESEEDLIDLRNGINDLSKASESLLHPDRVDLSRSIQRLEERYGRLMDKLGGG